ncbi:ABC transporter substrate-binding protein [Rhodohalobacter sp.]|uniref:MlaC/ttg2D family ABC transporter substrate-binding protein n=1 Tax=Rhodohalobacter sp. TaxID=1974210 RepID=UPI002ACDCF32|nr:ABC transporter substrate-binding protein [Rhodohalobacter sp.]MDZ7755306.1 ABC transporter substrate-binding protein [Rhodohalobacter sp.]
MKTIITLLFSMVLFLNVGNAQNGADEIQEMLNERDAEIKELLGPKGNEYTQEQRDRLKNIINDVIDFRSMSETALGDTYTEISEEKREEFVSLFSTIIRDNSLNRLDIYRAEVTYNGITVENGTAEVKTMAQMDNVRTSVDYDMELQDGEWQIIDMSIDDVSTAESYRRQFQSIIRQRGFDALLESLRRRAARA